jgi:oligoendopeptidase F
VEPELKTVGKAKILDFLMAKPEYQPYVLDYELFFEEAAHILSEHDEELLSKVALSRGAIDGMYDPLAYADNQETFIE